MPRLAFSTCAVLREPYDHPATRPFDELTPQVYATAERHPAFVCRADYADDRDDLEETERDWGGWGPLVLPAGYRARFGDGPYRAAQTLSVWTDLRGVRDFVYSGLHLATLKRRDEWFQPVDWPPYVVWWIDEALPTWQDAADRLDLLAELGPTPRAFDLRHPFDSTGPVTASGRRRREPGAVAPAARRDPGAAAPTTPRDESTAVATEAAR